MTDTLAKPIRNRFMTFLSLQAKRPKPNHLFDCNVRDEDNLQCRNCFEFAARATTVPGDFSALHDATQPDG